MIQHLYRTYQVGLYCIDAIDSMTEKTQYWLYRLNSSVKLRLKDTEILDAEEELSHVYSSSEVSLLLLFELIEYNNA